jgi:glycosyltransferase involved in cell wall biosynthesis
MRIALVSKACLVGAYQRKLEELAALPDVDLAVVVPPAWRDERGTMALEREHVDGYRLLVEPIAFDGNYHLYFFPRIARRLESLCPDLIHVDEEPYNFATYHVLRIARRLRAKTVFFAWQNLNRRYPFPFNWLERTVLRHADACIAGNRDGALVWRAKGFRGPIEVIPQFGVDPDIFSPDERVDAARDLRPSQVFTIGYVGRLVEEKGVDLLIGAVSGLKGDWRLEIVGSGPMRDALAALVDRLSLYDRVTFRPWLPSAQLPAIYSTLDALVLPSRSKPSWKEQFGRTLIEAMACGAPVIGSTCGEIPNVVGDAGLLFPEGDAGALRAHLERLMCDPGLRRDLAARGRARVLQHYTQRQIAQATAAVYRFVLAGMT